MIKITECPRDAMQGIHTLIPAEKKAEYINLLLKTGFDTIDFGSFVSPKAIPQMQDTAQVLKKLDLDATHSKLLAIIANTRGANDAASHDEIHYLGFPFSISETFQQRNTNASIQASLKTVEEVQNICLQKNKKLLVYFSMAFGNPYGDVWHSDIVVKWAHAISAMGIKHIALADTVAMANPENISLLFSTLLKEFPNIEFGAHLHTTPANWEKNVKAAYENGCKRFDCAIRGYGGCPMATDELVGNLPSENLIDFLEQENEKLGLDKHAFQKALIHANSLFTAYT